LGFVISSGGGRRGVGLRGGGKGYTFLLRREKNVSFSGGGEEEGLEREKKCLSSSSPVRTRGGEKRKAVLDLGHVGHEGREGGGGGIKKKGGCAPLEGGKKRRGLSGRGGGPSLAPLPLKKKKKKKVVCTCASHGGGGRGFGGKGEGRAALPFLTLGRKKGGRKEKDGPGEVFTCKGGKGKRDPKRKGRRVHSLCA